MPVLRVVLAFLLAATLLALADPAEAAYGDRCRQAGHNRVAEADLLRSTNNLRAMVHVPRLQPSTTLAQLARAHARSMASRRRGLWHTDIAPGVRGWAWLGQNVGYGPTVASLQYAFLHSPGHRSTMFYRRASRIGVGAWCDGRGTLWVAVNFMQAR